MAALDDTIMLPEKFWNDVNNPAICSLQTDAVQPRWQGLLGRCWFANDEQAQQMSDTSVGTLRAGWYAYVQTKSGSTAAPARGIPCVFATISDAGNYIVNPDISATTEGLFAGVYISAPTKGYYCIIQVGGLCTIKYRATVTSTNIGDTVQLLTATATFDALGDAVSSFTAGGGSSTVVGLKNFHGTAVEAPTNAGLKLANITPNLGFFKLR